MSSGNRFPKCFVQTLHDVFSAAHPNFKRVVRSVRRAARRKEAAVHLEPLPLYFPRCMPAAGPAGVRSPAHGPRNGARLDGAPPTAALKDTCVSARATRPGAAGIYPGGSIPEGRAASGGGAQNKRTSLRMSFCSEVLRQSGYFSANRYRPSGRRHECAVQAFWTKAKNLAQGQFICPEHVKSPSVAKK